jgi:nucleotide-binding universal stress UspA family protein
MYSRILVPIDGSEPSKLALDEALELACLLHAAIRLLHVVDVGSLLASEATAASYDSLLDLMRREGEQLLLNAAAPIRRAGIVVDTALVEAPEVQVGECVVRKAHEYQAELIVCGTHGRRGLRRLLMGSDAEYIVRHSPVPVLLVRIPDTASKMSAAAVGAAA